MLRNGFKIYDVTTWTINNNIRIVQYIKKESESGNKFSKLLWGRGCKNSRQKFKYLENEKSSQAEIKVHFILFEGLSLKQNNFL